jgi:hypothetical protein
MLFETKICTLLFSTYSAFLVLIAYLHSIIYGFYKTSDFFCIWQLIISTLLSSKLPTVESVLLQSLANLALWSLEAYIVVMDERVLTFKV